MNPLLEKQEKGGNNLVRSRSGAIQEDSPEIWSESQLLEAFDELDRTFSVYGLDPNSNNSNTLTKSQTVATSQNMTSPNTPPENNNNNTLLSSPSKRTEFTLKNPTIDVRSYRSTSKPAIPTISLHSPPQRVTNRPKSTEVSLAVSESVTIIALHITIEDYEELKSARVVTLRIQRKTTVAEALHKVALRGNVYIIASNYQYGMDNYDLVLLAEAEDGKIEEKILPKEATLGELKLKDRSNVVLRKKKRERVPVVVIIESYQLLQSARQVVSYYYLDEPIIEVLHKVAKKSSVNIPLNEEKNYGLFWWKDQHSSQNPAASQYIPNLGSSIGNLLNSSGGIPNTPGTPSGSGGSTPIPLKNSGNISTPSSAPSPAAMSMANILNAGGKIELMDINKTLAYYGVRARDVLYLKKKQHTDQSSLSTATAEDLHLLVEIADFQELECVRKTSLLIPQTTRIDEVLLKIAKKGTVNIPDASIPLFELVVQKGELRMEPKKTLQDYDLKNLDILLLRKRIITEEDNKEQLEEEILASDPLMARKNRIVGSSRNIYVPQKSPQSPQLGNEIKNGAHKLNAATLFGNIDLTAGTEDRILRVPQRGPVSENPEENSEDGLGPIIGYEDCLITGKIGQGSFGKVYRGLYAGKEVAVKILKELPEEKHVSEFQHEVSIMRETDCQYTVKLYGTIEEPKRMCIIMEYASRGSLFHVLNSELYDIGWDRIFKISADIVKGMQYLHSMQPHPIVHRDLKSLNILVTDNWEIKICDFGLSRLKTGLNAETLRKLRSTPAWSAPELLDEVEFTPSSDIYAIGVIIWECIYRCIKGKYERPFAEYKEIMFDYQILMQAAKKLKRPTIPASCPAPMVALCQKMWDNDPEARPGCAEILGYIEEMRADYEKDREAWDRVKEGGK